MSVSAEGKAQLRRWLADAPAPVREWLNPRGSADALVFNLHEIVLIGRKG
jgi:hypothetical protein